MKRGGGKKAPKAPAVTQTPANQLGGNSGKTVSKINNMPSTGSALSPSTGPASGRKPKVSGSGVTVASSHGGAKS